jgi:DNA polymerase
LVPAEAAFLKTSVMAQTRQSRMKRLIRQVARCPRCPELVASRTAPVFGAGKLSVKALLVGEAPGRQEDARGQPFVGQAGKLLDELLDAVGLKRSDVFLTNVIKCRPPNNRTPKSQEICNCLPYLHEQIALVKPRIICALGRIAACALLQTNQPLESLRGKTHEYEGIPLICTFHPAFVRRTPAAWAGATKDFRRLRKLASRAHHGST